MAFYLTSLFGKSETGKEKEPETWIRGFTKYRTRNVDPNTSFEIYSGSSKCRTCEKKYSVYHNIVLVHGNRISEKLRLKQDDEGGGKKVLEVGTDIGKTLREAKANFDIDKLRGKGKMSNNNKAGWVIEEKFYAMMECCHCAALAHFDMKIATADEGETFKCYLNPREENDT